MFGLPDNVSLAILTACASFIASYAATKVTLRYMERDIMRAQATADGAHGRIDSILGYPGGKRSYDPPPLGD